ncbi:hypothetical protein SAMN04487981_13911 [Streptomyces sp. cf386]|uniref:hypothetical protein n=1 Tax=Streptomyces sp. cf386 TaxID=1761904 RepID=UPI00088E1A32|nr:hypothetical protein [Streptomyces sp. cf386]SDP77135.1 hypothetical protein SAMN04487981_13911 [Streptomyces sp. cf386]
MGTKTVDESGADSGTQAKTDEEKVDVVKTTEATEATEATDSDEVTENDEIEAEDEVTAEATEEGPTGVGQGAGAVVSAALGLVSLTGGWIGTVAAARETLVGQLETASNASVAQQIKEVYGDAWQTSAVWAGVFALAALIVGVVVLARPAFGAPGKPQATWIKSVAWGGVALGVIGLLLAVLKYTDALLGLPTAS